MVMPKGVPQTYLSTGGRQGKKRGPLQEERRGQQAKKTFICRGDDHAARGENEATREILLRRKVGRI